MSFAKLLPIRRGRNNTPADVMLKPRKMGFVVDKPVPRYWAAGDPIKTHFLNAVSTILPQGEDFFIQKLRDNMQRITDPELLLMCRKFCGQEGHHAREHRTFNEYLKNQGYKHLPTLDKWLASYIGFLSSRTDSDTDLVFVANTEHMTAVMGHVLLRDADQWLEDHNVASSLLFWHVVEEVEHKAVAYDVYDHISGNYWKRVLWMPVVVGTVSASIVANQMYMLHVDGELQKPKTWPKLGKFYLGEGGVVRQIFNKEFWRYMLPSYHPWQLDDRHLIKKWEDKYEAQEDLRSVRIADVMA